MGDLDNNEKTPNEELLEFIQACGSKPDWESGRVDELYRGMLIGFIRGMFDEERSSYDAAIENYLNRKAMIITEWVDKPIDLT